MPKILPSVRGGEVHIPIVTLFTTYGAYLLIALAGCFGIFGGISMDILPYITNDALIAGAITAFVMAFLVGLVAYHVGYKNNKVEALRRAVAEGTTVPERKLRFDPRYYLMVLLLAIFSAAFVTVVDCVIGRYLGAVDSWLIAGMVGFFIGPAFAIVFDRWFFHDVATGETTVGEKLAEELKNYAEAQKKVAAAAQEAKAETVKALEGVDPEVVRALAVLFSRH